MTDQRKDYEALTAAKVKKQMRYWAIPMGGQVESEAKRKQAEEFVCESPESEWIQQLREEMS